MEVRWIILPSLDVFIVKPEKYLHYNKRKQNPAAILPAYTLNQAIRFPSSYPIFTFPTCFTGNTIRLSIFVLDESPHLHSSISTPKKIPLFCLRVP